MMRSSGKDPLRIALHGAGIIGIAVVSFAVLWAVVFKDGESLSQSKSLQSEGVSERVATPNSITSSGVPRNSTTSPVDPVGKDAVVQAAIPVSAAHDEPAPATMPGLSPDSPAASIYKRTTGSVVKVISFGPDHKQLGLGSNGVKLTPTPRRHWIYNICARRGPLSEWWCF